MNEILQGLIQAFWLVLSFDSELITISLRSLYVTLTALTISTLIAFPLAAFLVVTRFRFRQAIIATLNALMGLPPVVVGLIVYILFSRSGPLGVLGLLYTTSAMIIAQAIIITPLITSIAHQSMQGLWVDYRNLLISINVSKMQSLGTLMWDSKKALITACLAGFGRGIGEVGAIMIVGGNIDNATRVLTTAISLETSRGDFALALALGFVLISLAISVSFATHWFGKTERGGLQ
jgi:tungstate transport system permease protein